VSTGPIDGGPIDDGATLFFSRRRILFASWVVVGAGDMNTMNLDLPRATKTQGTFRQSCAVRCDVRARADAVWAILTDAARYPSWNSTVTSLEGDIRAGARLKLRVPLDPKRTFSPKVTRLDDAAMVWSDGFAPMFRGVRTFTLTPKAGGVTEFVMEEIFSGVMLPLIRRSLPDFGPAFEAFARDLKRAAEVGSDAGDGHEQAGGR